MPFIAQRILDLATLADGPLPERFTDRQLQVKAGLALGGAGQGELELQRQGDCLATGQVARRFQRQGPAGGAIGFELSLPVTVTHEPLGRE